MKMVLLLLTAAAFLGSVQAFTHEDANQYIDTVLQNRFLDEVRYSRLEPYKLEDIKVSLNYSKRTEGSAILSKGQLSHLSKVRRSTDCTVPFYDSANVTFTCFLRFDLLRLNYTASVSYDNSDLVFYPRVAVDRTNITIQVTSSAQEDIPTLKLLFVSNIGNINVTTQMISIGDSAQYIGPQIRSVLVTHTVRNLHSVINGRFKNALAYSIYKTPVGFAG